MTKRGTILVVGGGIAGLSTAWALSRRGFEVDLFEVGPLPNPMASSYDEHRIIRHAYGTMEGYAHLMPQAFRVWEAMWQDLGARHFEAMPAVYVLRGDDSWYEASRRSLTRMGVDISDIPLADAERCYPMINLAGLRRVVRTEGAGVLFPIRILTDLVVNLAGRGVRLHSGSRVVEVDAERGAVRTGERTFGGDGVVVTAGAWADRLVPSLRGTAVASRQAVLFLAPPPDLAPAWRNAPVLVDLGPDTSTYTLPPRPGTRLKVGDHTFSRTGDPDGDRTGTTADVAPLERGARIAYRDFERYTVLERKACFYTVTDDERFLVHPIGACGWVMSACSGHGFKLAPLIADGVAAAIAGERDPAGVPDWAAGRLIPA